MNAITLGLVESLSRYVRCPFQTSDCLDGYSRADRRTLTGVVSFELFCQSLLFLPPIQATAEYGCSTLWHFSWAWIIDVHRWTSLHEPEIRISLRSWNLISLSSAIFPLYLQRIAITFNVNRSARSDRLDTKALTHDGRGTVGEVVLQLL